MELLPCPFCGGEADIERIGDRRQSTQYACQMCGCFLETGEEWNHGTRWNKRINPLEEFKKELKERRNLGDCLETDEDFVLNNLTLCVKLLDKLKRLN